MPARPTDRGAKLVSVLTANPEIGNVYSDEDVMIRDDADTTLSTTDVATPGSSTALLSRLNNENVDTSASLTPTSFPPFVKIHIAPPCRKARRMFSKIG
jgi:hypothetical protein